MGDSEAGELWESRPLLAEPSASLFNVAVLIFLTVNRLITKTKTNPTITQEWSIYRGSDC